MEPGHMAFLVLHLYGIRLKDVLTQNNAKALTVVLAMIKEVIKAKHVDRMTFCFVFN